MAKLEYGACSPDVKKLQQDINKIMGKGTVPENGEFGEKTRDKIAEMQKKMGKMQTGTADKVTLAEMKDAMVERTQVTVKGKTAWVTKSELATLKSKANGKAAGAVQGYVDMANHAKTTWDRHFKTRESNWFWSGVVDVAAGISFPAKNTIDKAVSAANSMKTAAAAGTLKDTALGSQSAPIRTAFAAMDQYEDELFGGGAGLIGQLQNIQTACVTVLQVSAAVATGGASWQIQVGVAAGMGAYEAVLGEIDKAPTDHKQTAGSAAKAIFKGAAVDGGIALVMKGGGKGLSNFGDDVIKEAVKESAKGGSKALLKEYGKRALVGGGQKLVEDGIKTLANLDQAGTPKTGKEFVTAAATSFAKGAGFGVLGPAADKFGKGASKHFSQADFKGLGKVKLSDALADGGKAVLDKAGTAAVKKTLATWTPKKNHSSFEKEVKMCMLKDPTVSAWVSKAAKKKKK